ncbi:type III-A CRISPR-associated protein Cas10/Csm1 [Patescibacteria group bacterium]|nr:type III-A CRISPR-associated protein Cas10/Csm1 [Patescibacteria group bacterium]
MLRFGINLLYRFYSGKWVEQPDLNAIPENVKRASEALCGVNLFTEEFQFPDKWISSIFSDISFRPVIPVGTYYPPNKIEENKIRFPSKIQGINKGNNEIAQRIKIYYDKLKENPDALLMILEKYGSFVPIGENSPISLYEHMKFLEAIRQCNNSYLLASADFSGIQSFIYTISSKGALKSLRACSFFLSLLSEHIVYEILKKQGLNRSSIIFSGGGSFCLLVPQNTQATLRDIKEKINSYFLHILGGKLYLGLVWSECEIEDLMSPNFRNKWAKIGNLLEEDKYKKFGDNLQDFLAVTMPKKLTNQDECQICHRDDCDVMEQLSDNGGQINVCHLCKEFFYLGDALTDYQYINRWENEPQIGYFLEIPSLNGNSYYWVDKKPNGTFHWIKNSFQPNDCWPSFTADYVTQDEKGDTADFQYLADKSEGKKLIGCLRMDVDNLGTIFSDRVDSNLFSPLALSALSKTLNLFFTIYMNLICEKQIDSPLLIQTENREERRPVSIIYSGGDDLLIIGAWNEVCELSLDIRRNFKKYVGDNEDISISGGAFLAHSKFPFYQMANFSGKAEEIAKRNYGKCIKEDCCEDYTKCPFYEPAPKPKCKRKDSGLLFYTPSREDKKRGLERDPKTKGRIETTLKWDEIECKVITPLENMYPIFKQNRETVISRSLIYRFFSLVDKWENDGILYLPLMAWVIERLKKISNAKVNSQIINLSSIVFNTKYMSSLYIPLTWLDLLKREGR